MDELLGQERADVGVFEDVAQSVFEILARGPTGGQNHAAEQALLPGIVALLHRLHAAVVILPVRPVQRTPGIGRIGPAGEGAGELQDVLFGVGRQGLAVRTHLRRPVRVEEVHAQGEQLQQLTRPVFVGRLGILFRLRGVVDHVEVGPHGRAQSHFAQQIEVVAERVLVENPQVGNHLVAPSHAVGGDHQDLAQRENHALAQLILAVEAVVVEAVLHGVQAADVVFSELRGACCELLVQELLRAEFPQPGDQLRRGPPGGMVEQPRVGFGEHGHLDLIAHDELAVVSRQLQ